MFDTAELKRKLKNIVRVTSIVTPNDTQALGTVSLGDDLESLEFPILSFANSFKKHWIPARAGEQVLVLFPFGNANKGYIVRGIFSKKQKEPSGANSTTEVVEFEDGARLSYDTSGSIMKITGVKVVLIESGSKVTLKSPTVILDAEVKVTKNLTVDGKITDVKGDLTNHKHTVQNHAVAVPR